MDLMGRHQSASLPFVAVFIGFFPAITFPELTGYGSRTWTGVAIGTLIVIGPVVLICLRRTRHLGGVGLFVLGAFAMVHAGEAKLRLVVNGGSLTAPGEVESVSAAAMVLSWSTLVLFSTGVVMAFGQGRGRRHYAWVEISGSGYVAACDCGWHGAAEEEYGAFVEAGDHANRVQLQVRPPRSFSLRRRRPGETFFPDRLLLDQPGRALVRLPDRPDDPARSPPERAGPGERDPHLDRPAE